MNLCKILSVANLVLLVIWGYVLAGAILDRKTERHTIARSEPIQASSPEQAFPVMTMKDCSIIIERNVFSHGDGRNVAKHTTRKEATALAKTQLRIRLLGTVAGDITVACAVIEDLTTKTQDLYEIGDVIQGARIDSIERNRIVLHHRKKECQGSHCFFST